MDKCPIISIVRGTMDEYTSPDYTLIDNSKGSTPGNQYYYFYSKTVGSSQPLTSFKSSVKAGPCLDPEDSNVREDECFYPLEKDQSGCRDVTLTEGTVSVDGRYQNVIQNVDI